MYLYSCIAMATCLLSWQRRATNMHTDRRGILWLLDEESMFPGGSDSSFVERVQMYHGEADERGVCMCVCV